MIFDITATQNTLKRCFFFETMCEGCLFAPIILKSRIGAADTLLNLQHNADYVMGGVSDQENKKAKQVAS